MSQIPKVKFARLLDLNGAFVTYAKVSRYEGRPEIEAVCVKEEIVEQDGCCCHTVHASGRTPQRWMKTLHFIWNGTQYANDQFKLDPCGKEHSHLCSDQGHL